MKEMVLKAVRDKQLKIKGNEVKILKEIPWRARQKRREYNFLVEFSIGKFHYL